MSVPTVVVRLQGWRDDPAHLAAFAHARALFCPFPQAFEWSRLPGDLEQKCYYEGCYDRLGALEVEVRPSSAKTPDPTDPTIRRILVLVGSGGTRLTASELDVLARAVPAARVEVLGPVRDTGPRAANLHFLGQRNYVLPYLQRADLVIGGRATMS